MSHRVAVSTAEQAVDAVRAGDAEHILLLFAADLPPLDAALLRAALGPLAIERAPTRVNALLAHPGADSAAVEAAAIFLEGARSTTGQLIEVAP